MFSLSLERMSETIGHRIDQSKLNLMSKSNIVNVRTKGVLEAVSDYADKFLQETTYVNDEGAKMWYINASPATTFKGNNLFLLKQSVVPHAHQMDALESFYDQDDDCFYSMRLRSPCASGKTLMALLMAAILIQKTGGRVLFVVNSNVAIHQVKKTALDFFRIEEEDVLVIDTDTKPQELYYPSFTIAIGTYQSLCTCTTEKEGGVDFLFFKEMFYSMPLFTAAFFDEAYSAPADKYFNIMKNIKTPICVAMSATLDRMDNKMDKMIDFIGSRIFEVNRKDLVEEGILPDVERVDVSIAKKEEQHVGVGGANFYCVEKLDVFLNLLVMSVFKNKNIIVFFETIVAMNVIYDLVEITFESMGIEKEVMVGKFFGKTRDEDRLELMNVFRGRHEDEKAAVLFMTQVGDTALDLPADTEYQLRRWTPSKMKETQRLGRISRVVEKETERVAYSLNLCGSSEHENADILTAEMEVDGYNTTKIESSSIPRLSFKDAVVERLWQSSEALRKARDEDDANEVENEVDEKETEKHQQRKGKRKLDTVVDKKTRGKPKSFLIKKLRKSKNEQRN